MRCVISIGLIAASFILLAVDYSVASCSGECPKGQNSSCVSGGGSCFCTCIPNMQVPSPQAALAKHIQAKEGVDKSKIVNLDAVLQKALKESSQKIDTPVKFTVKVQTGENTPPKEVEYQITTSR